jgi:DNA topoisomerase IB
MLGALTASGAVAVGVTVVATLVVVAFVASLVAAIRAARALRRSAAELQREAHALMGQLQQTVDVAGRELERVDDLIGSAEKISSTVGSASRLAQAAMATPVIKVMALGAGTARASERMRSRGRRQRGR